MEKTKVARRPIADRLDEMQRQLLSMAGERTPEAAALRSPLMLLAQQVEIVLNTAKADGEKKQ